MDKRTLRTRKVSERMSVVDEGERRRALQKRLDALEEDNHRDDDFGAGSEDEEFQLPAGSDDEEGGPPSGKKRKKARVGGGMRKTRGMIAEKKQGARSLRDHVEEAGLEQLPPEVPTYLTAAVGPPISTSGRKFCSVCGDASKYTCVRCGSRFCCNRCYVVHTETRCLKFMA